MWKVGGLKIKIVHNRIESSCLSEIKKITKTNNNFNVFTVPLMLGKIITRVKLVSTELVLFSCFMNDGS